MFRDTASRNTLALLGIALMILGHKGWSQQEREPRGKDFAVTLQDYSARAKYVFFLARVNAGKEGADSVGVRHLILALIAEDQSGNKLPQLDSGTPTAGQIRGHESRERRASFFSVESAAFLTSKLEALASPGSSRLALTQDMPVSGEVSATMALSLRLAKSTNAEEVEPLHLLAAAMEQKSEPAVRSLFDAHITQDEVLRAISSK